MGKSLSFFVEGEGETFTRFTRFLSVEARVEGWAGRYGVTIFTGHRKEERR